MTLAMHRVDEDRRLVAERLREVLQVTGADRSALVWIDEYGPGLVHPYCVLDILSDRPRRSFAIDPLRRAWKQGIPGLLDEPDLVSSHQTILAEAPRSLASVALGSDGLRSWFLVVDSRTPRSSFDAGTTDELMFLAGECASIVIHEDLEASRGARGRTVGVHDTTSSSTPLSSFERERRSRFPGWPVLRDVDDGTDDSGRHEAVTLRFLVARLIRELADDGFTVDADVYRHRIDAVRGEIREVSGSGVVSGQWKDVLDSLENQDFGRLSASVLSLAVDAEDEGHLHGARELNRLAYDVAVAGSHAEHGVDAARYLGRVNRRLGSWEESERWYECAVGVARAAGLVRGQALALDGLGNTFRVRGNFPKAREAYLEVLEVGEEIPDSDLRGRAHQN
ncbi:MAG: tetratricopeptide repeat protein, partial [Longimicrobiales bacterium]|nr:tetratricopeptide repeat protein [Longimicrobiales bacterium]